MVDWNKIKAEYIAGGTSYRKLAEKHGVARQSLEKVAKREGWVSLRGQAEDMAEAKIVDEVVRQSTNTGVKINAVADKLLRKLSDAIDRAEVIDGQTIKQFTSALKDIKDIKGEKSRIDIKEQKARIAKLQKDVQKDNDAVNEIEVVFMAGPEEWNE